MTVWSLADADGGSQHRPLRESEQGRRPQAHTAHDTTRYRHESQEWGREVPDTSRAEAAPGVLTRYTQSFSELQVMGLFSHCARACHQMPSSTPTFRPTRPTAQPTRTPTRVSRDTLIRASTPPPPRMPSGVLILWAHIDDIGVAVFSRCPPHGQRGSRRENQAG